MTTEPLIWPGDGREMVWGPNGLSATTADGSITVRYRGQEASPTPWQALTPVLIGGGVWDASPQAALNALHARLCAQADALDAVTGRGTVAQERECAAGYLMGLAESEQASEWSGRSALALAARDLMRGKHLPEAPSDE